MKKYISLLMSVTLVGCTTYPKNYTYSPSVTISGDGSAVALPGPFSKKSPNAYSQYSHSPTYQRPFYLPNEQPLDDVIAFVDQTTTPTDFSQIPSELVAY
jgi:hypothetical protein